MFFLTLLNGHVVLFSFKLVNNEKDFWKNVSKPTYISRKTFDKNFAAIHEIKPILTLSKPIYVRSTIPELSKWLIYDFQYNFIKKIDAELLFPDTHSLIYEMKLEVFMKSFLNTSTCLTLVNNIFFLCSL